MATHLIIGKGPVGSATADLLASQGNHVRVVSRSGGSGAETPGGGSVEHLAVDAADARALTAAADGAVAIYNCANPTVYHRWAAEWPPMATAMLDAAEATGATLVMTGNLYAYGPVDGPITPDLPLAAPGTKGQVRARMWAEALARHDVGRVHVVEARASDFIGPRVTDGGHLGERAVPRLLHGKGVKVLGDPDAPHSWTYVPDVARTLVTLGGDERAWGRAWHVPTVEARSARQMVTALCDAAGVAPVAVGRVPWSMVRLGGLVVPMLRELGETRYQFDRPFVLDSTETTGTFGIEPTPLEAQCAATVAWWRARLGLAEPTLAAA
ncbi:MAG: NAD-dependent epimerase/dehydratase family protein [Acidimicrobiales bacterium]